MYEYLYGVILIRTKLKSLETDRINSELLVGDETGQIHSETTETVDSDEEFIIDNENPNFNNMPRKRCRVIKISDFAEQ